MREDEILQDFLNKCHREYLRRQQENQWLWDVYDDSTDAESVVE